LTVIKKIKDKVSNPYKKILVLFFVALAGFLYTIAKTSIGDFPPDALYLAKSLPIPYWVGLSSLVVSLGMTMFPKKDEIPRVVDALNMLMLGLYLSIPAIVIENAWYNDAYFNMSDSISILNNGNFNNLPTVTGLYYPRDYPGSFLFNAEIYSLTGANPLLIMKYYPIFQIFVTILLGYLIGWGIHLQRPALTALPFLGYLWFGWYIEPQMFAIIPYFLVWLALFKITETESKRYASWIIIAVLSMGTIVISEPTDNPFVYMNFAVILFATILFPRFFSLNMRKLWVAIFLIYAILSESWAVYNGQYVVGLAKTATSSAIDAAENLIAGNGIHNIPTSPSAGYAISVDLNLGISVFVFVSGIFLFFMLLRRITKSDSIMNTLPAWFVSPLVAFPIAAFSATTFTGRVFLFALIPWTIGIWYIQKWPKHLSRSDKVYRLVVRISKACIIGSLLSMMLLPISLYGLEPFAYITTSNISEAQFVATQMNGTVLYQAPEAWTWRFVESTYGQIPTYGLSLKGLYVTTSCCGNKTSSLNYDVNATLGQKGIVLAEEWLNTYLLRQGSAEPLQQYYNFENQIASDHNLIYSSAYAVIYLKPIG
jgi:hypothetical protein